MKNMFPATLAVAYLLAAPVQPSFSQGTFYTSRSVFESALGSSTTITFEGLPVTPEGGIGEDNIAVSGVTFRAGSLFVRDSFAPIPASGNYLHHFDGCNPVFIMLPGGVTGFGADFSSAFGAPNPMYDATVIVHLAGGQAYAYNFTAELRSWTFFGVTFPEPIAYLSFDDGAGPPVPPCLHNEMLDNVIFGIVVPEPRTFCLLTLGGLCFTWRCFRRFRT